MGCTAKNLKWVGRFERREESRKVICFERVRARGDWAKEPFKTSGFALAPPVKVDAPRKNEGKETSSRG